jgi:hypothetical protein
MLSSVKMPPPRDRAIAKEGHDCSADVKSPQGYGPLKGPNDRLVEEFAVIDLGMISLLERRIDIQFWLFAKHHFIIAKHLLDVLAWRHVKGAIVFAKEIATKMVCDVSGALQFELVFFFEDVNECLWITHGECEIVNVSK